MMKNLGSLRNKSVLVLGDCILDRFIRGSVTRISPEAPVPIVSVTDIHDSLGGAANVAAGVTALGAAATLYGVIGMDSAGARLKSLIEGSVIDSSCLVMSPQVATVCKSRLIASSNQQLLRFDEEGAAEQRAAVSKMHYSAALEQFSRHNVVLLSDYEKGTLPSGIIVRLIEEGRRRDRAIIVDPKKTDFSVYSGATVLTPNRLELERAVGRPLPTIEMVTDAAVEVCQRHSIESVVGTCGSDGMVLVTKEGQYRFPAHVRQVADTTGAGDTVASVLAVCIADGWSLNAACALATEAAGISVSKPGVYVVRNTDLASSGIGSGKIATLTEAMRRLEIDRKAGRRIVFTNGCFDILHAGHLSCFEAAKRMGHVLVVGMNSDASVQRLKGVSRPIISETHRARLLAGLECVDLVVIFDDDTPESLLASLSPDILVKGGDYTLESVVGAEFVRSYGGEVVVLPLVDGLSTTSIARAHRTRVP